MEKPYWKKADFWTAGRGWKFTKIRSELMRLDLKDKARVKDFCKVTELQPAVLKTLKDYQDKCTRLYSPKSVEVFLVGAIRLTKFVKKPLSKITEKDITAYAEQQNKTQIADSSKRLLRCSASLFIKHLAGLDPNDDLPDYAKGLKSLRGKRGKGGTANTLTIKADEILKLEEVMAIVRVASNARDKAMIFCLFDTGCRFSELINLKVGDIIKGEHYWSAHIEGKTGDRQVYMPRATNALKTWLNQHPLIGKEDNPFVFCPTGAWKRNAPISSTAAHLLLKTLAKKAGIPSKRRINPHAFRHSRCCEEARAGTNESIANQMFGWTANSGMFKHYSHMNQKDVENTLDKRYGIVKEQAKSKMMQLCPKCNSKVALDVKMCGCGWWFDPALAKKMTENQLQRDKDIEEYYDQKWKKKIAVMAKEAEANFENKTKFRAEMETMLDKIVDERIKKSKNQQTLERYA